MFPKLFQFEQEFRSSYCELSLLLVLQMCRVQLLFVLEDELDEDVALLREFGGLVGTLCLL